MIPFLRGADHKISIGNRVNNMSDHFISFRRTFSTPIGVIARDDLMAVMLCSPDDDPNVVTSFIDCAFNYNLFILRSKIKIDKNESAASKGEKIKSITARF